MKKLLLIFLLLGCLISPTETVAQVDYGVDNYVGWSKVGVDGYEHSSWFYCVTRSKSTDSYGYYWYDVWFTSNSYTYDYYSGKSIWRYVQIENCGVTFNGYPSNGGTTISFSFINNYTPTTLRYKTKKLYPIFKIYWGTYYKL